MLRVDGERHRVRRVLRRRFQRTKRGSILQRKRNIDEETYLEYSQDWNLHMIGSNQLIPKRVA